MVTYLTSNPLSKNPVLVHLLYGFQRRWQPAHATREVLRELVCVDTGERLQVELSFLLSGCSRLRGGLPRMPLVTKQVLHEDAQVYVPGRSPLRSQRPE